jgi:hypothetical protein
LPLHKPSKAAKPWWNTEIRLVLKLARDWKSKAKKELMDTNTIFTETLNALNKAKIKNFKNRIKQEKKKWSQKILKEAHTDDI